METRSILVLGSGMVAKPCVDYLLRNRHNRITVACRRRSTAEKLRDGRDRVTAISVDVQQPSELDHHIAGHDLVISLVPFIYHPDIVRSAIRGNTNVVTTSYISPAMKELDGSVKEAGITVLNEVGMDPGVDHLYAVKVIDEVHEKGGKVREFYSYCGGLPAPEASDNPLRFKFSWSPRGALLSQFNSAAFLKQGEVVEISNKHLMETATPYHVIDGYDVVAYPNRNSVPFREAYQIPEAHTVIRGSLRYPGNPSMVKALIDLGWLDTQPKAWLKDGITWAEIQQKAIAADSPAESDLIRKVDEVCSFAANERDNIISGLRWMGLFSDGTPIVHENMLDTLSAHLEKICRFQPGERDLVLLQHKFVVEWQDGSKDTITSTLELFGDPDGYSAMARSVGVTCGIATQMLLDGHPALKKPGILAPYTKNICDAIRAQVEAEGIRLTDRVL